jgi:hypothetical protein
VLLTTVRYFSCIFLFPLKRLTHCTYLHQKSKLKPVTHLKFYPYLRIPFLRNYSVIRNKLAGHILAPLRGPTERAFNLCEVYRNQLLQYYQQYSKLFCAFIFEFLGGSYF